MSESEDTLDNLLKHQPSSFSVLERTACTVCGTLKVETEYSIEASRFTLRIRCSGRSVRVREAEPGANLPTACPERHIEDDGNLCVGLKAGHDIATPDECRIWWSYLYQFLLLQVSADSTGRWPSKYALAHGEGGAAQLRAERAAQRLGLAADYREYLAGRQNYIAELVADYRKHRDEALTRNCDVGYIDDELLEHATALAKERGSQKLTPRKRARLVSILARADLDRIAKEGEYWAHCRKIGMTCCDTMLHCPLRQTMS